MQSLDYHVATSLDGFIARADGTPDFFLMEGPHVDAFHSAIADYAIVIMGRKTYELGLSHGVTDPYPGLETYVYSSTLSSPDPRVQVVSEDTVSHVAALKARAKGPIWLCGGGELAGTLFAAGLIDTLTVKINPVLVGSGTPLAALGGDVRLALLSQHAYDNGVLLLRYRRLK